MQRPIPVLFVYHSLRLGGVESELLSYLQHIDKKKYEVHLGLSELDGEMLCFLPDFVTVHDLQEDMFQRPLQYLWNLAKIIKTLQPVTVVGYMQDVNICILLVKLVFRYSFKPVITEHVVLSEWQKFYGTPFWKRWLVKTLYRSANVVVAASVSIKKDLESQFNISAKKIFLLPNSLPKTPQKKSGIENTNPFKKFLKEHQYFLFVGRITEQKNIAVLLKAFSLLHKSFPEIHLVLVGSGKIPFYQNVAEKLRVNNTVHFFGFQPSVDLFYQRAIAVILPSLVEGRSRVLIEAAFHKTPIICANFSGSELYVKDMKTGFIFNKNSVADLAKVLEKATTNKQTLEKYARNAYIAVTREYGAGFESRYTLAVDQIVSGENLEKGSYPFH